MTACSWHGSGEKASKISLSEPQAPPACVQVVDSEREIQMELGIEKEQQEEEEEGSRRLAYEKEIAAEEAGEEAADQKGRNPDNLQKPRERYFSCMEIEICSLLLVGLQITVQSPSDSEPGGGKLGAAEEGGKSAAGLPSDAGGGRSCSRLAMWNGRVPAVAALFAPLQSPSRKTPPCKSITHVSLRSL